jgi:hypothetical protein
MGYTVVDLRRNKQCFGAWSVALERDDDGLIYWVDVWIDSKHRDINADWQTHIVNTTTSEDAHREQVQEDNDEFDMATSEAICFLEHILEAVQDDSGNWYCNISTRNWEVGAVYVCR